MTWLSKSYHTAGVTGYRMPSVFEIEQEKLQLECGAVESTNGLPDYGR